VCGKRFLKVIKMSPVKGLALVLIVVGVLGLVYGTFSYTKETHDIKLGSLEMSVDEKQTVNIPVWSGVGAVGVGVVLFLVGKKN